MNITRLGTYDQIKGSSYKLPCRLATTVDVNLLSPPTVVDGVTASNNDRILVWKQSTGSQNGIYVVGATWSRAIDFSTEEDIFNGVQVYVTSGDTNQTSYILSASGSMVLDVTTLSFSSTSTNISTSTKALALKANQDGTILYHSTKWFVPSSTVSSSGTTVTSIGVQFTSGMVGAKLIISGEQRIITAFTSSTIVTVDNAYSTNYSNIDAGSWGVYDKSIETLSSGNINFYPTNSSTPITVIDNVNNKVSVGGIGILKSNNSIDGLNHIFMYGSIFGQTNTKFIMSDIGFKRVDSNSLEINNGTATIYRDLKLRKLIASSSLLVGDNVTDNGIDKLQANGSIIATGYKVPSGTSDQFLKADGSVSTLTNPVTGTLTTNVIPKATGANTLADSIISESGGNIGIGTGSPSSKLDVNGGLNVGGNITFGTNNQSLIANGNLNLQVGSYATLILKGSDINSQVSVVLGATNFLHINKNGIGIGTTTPQAKLDVAGAVKVGDDATAASATKAGALRYREDSNNSYVEMCVRTGASTYAWQTIIVNTW